MIAVATNMRVIILVTLGLFGINLKGGLMTCDLCCEARESSNIGSNTKRLSSNSRISRRKKIPTVVDEVNGVNEYAENRDELLSDDTYDKDKIFHDGNAYDQEISDDGLDARNSFEQQPKRRSQFINGETGSRSHKNPTRVQRSSRASSLSSSHRVAPYVNKQKPSAFSRGFTALRESMQDSQYLKNTLSNAKEVTSKISYNIYREVKGLSSSELEQVFLKVTTPNDLPVKDKHLERLLETTYQSARFDIYSSALRKLWSKMTENDWRTTIKAVYVLHRYSTDGAREHQPALKQRLREMRRTRDPKTKGKYFNSKQLLAGDSNPKNIPYRAFLARYAHYVLLRVQCFGGMFLEISENTPTKKSSKSLVSSEEQKLPPPNNVITSTRLKKEHLDVAKLLLKEGLACIINPEEVCEITAHATERVAADIIGLTNAVAVAINDAIKNYDDEKVDKALIKLWCHFYVAELLPGVRTMITHSTPVLEKYGLFLPPKMGMRVSEELLKKGMDYGSDKEKHENEPINDEYDKNKTNIIDNNKDCNEESTPSKQETSDEIIGICKNNRVHLASDSIEEEKDEDEEGKFKTNIIDDNSDDNEKTTANKQKSGDKIYEQCEDSREYLASDSMSEAEKDSEYDYEYDYEYEIEN